MWVRIPSSTPHKIRPHSSVDRASGFELCLYVTILLVAYKNIEESRAAIRRHYYANKAKYLEKNRLRRAAIRKYLAEIKSASPCTDCGIQYPYYVMDFDHLEDKKGLVSRFVAANNFSALRAEIAKCEIVCANCHRIRTFARLSTPR